MTLRERRWRWRIDEVFGWRPTQRCWSAAQLIHALGAEYVAELLGEILGPVSGQRRRGRDRLAPWHGIVVGHSRSGRSIEGTCRRKGEVGSWCRRWMKRRLQTGPSKCGRRRLGARVCRSMCAPPECRTATLQVSQYPDSFDTAVCTDASRVDSGAERAI